MLILTELNLKETFGEDIINHYENKYPVFQSEVVKKWIRNKVEKYSQKGKKPTDFQLPAYLDTLNKYCQFYNVSEPSRLLKENVDDRNKRLLRYLETLVRNGRSSVSVYNFYQSIIRSFYSDRGSPITRGITPIDSGANDNEIIFEKEDIKKISSHFRSPDYKLIALTQCEVGLRITDVSETMKNGKYQFEKYKDHYFIRNFRTKKNGIIINYIFLPNELAECFKNLYNISELEDLDLTTVFKTKYNTDININSFAQRLKAIQKKLNLKQNLKSHCYRKFFKSAMVNTKDVDIEFKEHLMGHKQSLTRAYNQKLRDIKWFYNNWLKIEPHIAVYTQIKHKSTEEYLKLREENIRLESQVVLALKKKQELEKKLEELKKELSSKASKYEIETLIGSMIKKELNKYKI